MEPLKPEVRAAILRDNPRATVADIQEYERCLALRFRYDPDAPAAPHLAAARDENEARIAELYRKLFPSGHAPQP